MSSNYKRNLNPCNIPFPCAFPIPEPPLKQGVIAYAFSEPASAFTTAPLLTVTLTETPITTVNINTTQNALIELRGLVGWSVTSDNDDTLIVWRIRKGGPAGPIIWEGHDGVGVDTEEIAGHISSMLHVDSKAALGTNTYQLTGQIDPISSGTTANINGPIVLAATAYSF